MIRQVLPPRHPWLERAQLVLATLLATGVLWAALLGALAAGCWRGGAPPCPPGTVSSGGDTTAPVCEVRPRVVRRYPRCDKLDTLVSRLNPIDLSPCDATFHDDYAWEHCVRQQYEFRVSALEWRWATAVAYCASENVP